MTPAPPAPPPPPPPRRRGGQWIRDVPDWARRGLRVAAAVWVLCFSANTLWFLTDEQERAWGDDVSASLMWGAATPAVIAASPLIGKVVQLSGDRTLGTAAGGALGFLAFELVFHSPLFPDEYELPILCTLAAAVGLLSCYLSHRLKLDQSMRLMVVTFVVVTFGAHPERGALELALLRTGGILLGVITMMALTVIVLPRSASIECIRESQKCLKLLVRLNAAVAVPLAADPPPPEAAAAAIAPPPPPPRPGGEDGSSKAASMTASAAEPSDVSDDAAPAAAPSSANALV